MPFDIYHPSCALKIILFAATSPEEPFSTFAQVTPEWFDVVEQDGAAPATLRNLNIKNTSPVTLDQQQKSTANRNGFLANSSSESLVSFDATPLWNIEIIGSGFLLNCKFLTTADFSKMPNCGEIGDNFLAGCPNLKNVDLSGFTDVNRIGSSFLEGSTSLKSVDLSVVCQKVWKIRDSFLASSGIESVDVSPLANNLREIPDYFLTECADLKEITGFDNFARMADEKRTWRLRRVGTQFLSFCLQLKEIDLDFLRHVDDDRGPDEETTDTKRNTNVVAKADVLKNNSNPRKHYVRIEQGFLYMCTSLETIHNCFFLIKSRSNNSASSVSTSTSSNVHTMCVLRKLGKDAFGGLRKLKNPYSLTVPLPLEFDHLSVAGILHHSITECAGSLCITIDGIMNDNHNDDVTSAQQSTKQQNNILPISFFNHLFDNNNNNNSIKKLKSVDLTALAETMKETTGNNFFRNCSSLETVILPKVFVNLTRIGHGFFANCTSLREINVAPFLMHCLVIGDEFFAGCTKLQEFLNFGNFWYERKRRRAMKMFLHAIGEFFLDGTAITTFDFRFVTWSQIELLPPNFLRDCRNLKEIDNMTANNKEDSTIYIDSTVQLKMIGSGFLLRCSSLEKIDFSGLSAVEHLHPDGFLEGCSSLRTIDLTPFRRLLFQKVEYNSLKKVKVKRLTTNDHTIFHRWKTAVYAGLQDYDGFAEDSPKFYWKHSFLGATFQGCTGLRELKVPGTFFDNDSTDEHNDNNININNDNDTSSSSRPIRKTMIHSRVRHVDAIQETVEISHDWNYNKDGWYQVGGCIAEMNQEEKDRFWLTKPDRSSVTESIVLLFGERGVFSKNDL